MKAHPSCGLQWEESSHSGCFQYKCPDLKSNTSLSWTVMDALRVQNTWGKKKNSYPTIRTKRMIQQTLKTHYWIDFVVGPFLVTPAVSWTHGASSGEHRELDWPPVKMLLRASFTHYTKSSFFLDSVLVTTYASSK